MSMSLARLKKRAAELEQKKQFDKALEVYLQILEEGGKELADDDVPLFNRVGDMLMRKGNVTEALGYYERAVDVYAERGFLNNAIALCSKVLRQSPGRTAVYYKLGKISARKGFKSDARKNFLEYADRMQKAGLADEAFRALKEFASLYPDQDDVRLILAELLSQENRKSEALEQLQSLYEKLEAEGRRAEARATVDRMKAIDPAMEPLATGAHAVQPAGDLVFLDLSDAAPRAPRPAPLTPEPPPVARAPIPPPVPALDGLTLTFVPDEDEEEPEQVSPLAGFEATAVDDAADAEDETGPAGATEERFPDIVDGMADHDEIEVLDDLVPTALEARADDDVAAPLREQPPLSGSEFSVLDLDDVPRHTPHRAHDLVLPGELPSTPEQLVTIGVTPTSVAATEDARAAAEEEADLLADIGAREAAQRRSSDPVTGASASPEDEDVEGTPDEELDGVFFGAADTAAEVTDEALLDERGFGASVGDPDDGTPAESPAEESDDADLQPSPDPSAAVDDVGETGVAPVAEVDGFLSEPPGFGASGDAGSHAFPPLAGLEAGDDSTGEDTGSAPTHENLRLHTPRSTLSIGGAERHLRGRLEIEPENWGLRRQLGEALLDVGDRDAGLYELELTMVGFELDGDIDRAAEVADEILSVSPGSIRHHQKRVEYAVRARDRNRLIHAYLELGDALFRTGAADKAVTVYGRVLELDGSNERAEFALATLAPDELARRRGGAPRPERWSEELNAIPDSGIGPPSGYPGPVTSASPVSIDAVLEAVDGAKPVGEEAGEAGQLPSLDAAGEGEASADGEQEILAGESTADDRESLAESSTESAQPVANEPTGADDHAADEPQEDGLASGSHAAAGEGATVTEATGPIEGSGDVPDESTPGADAVPDAPEAAPDEAPGPTGSEVWAEAPDEDHAAPEPEPAAWRVQPPPAPAGPDDPGMSRLERARRLTPVGGSDSDFVDLGEWLRLTEPAKSTRMTVEDPQPTGDEQADFEELLRRFKRGVAENVEAEDYEAHYDLGVAFKEMGLIDEAIAQFQKALRGTTQRVRSYEALGQCFVEKGQYPIAAALLRRATEIPGIDDQQLVGVLYLLGFATEHLGRPAEALPYYLRVFAVDIEFRDIGDRVAAIGNQTT